MLAETTQSAEEMAEKIDTEISQFQNFLDGMYSKALSFGVSVLLAIIIFIVGRFILKKLIKVVNTILNKSKIDEGVQKFVASFLNIIGYVVLVIIICNQVGIDTTSFVAILASGGLAVGLAFEGSLSNFAGGILLLIMKPFTIGDYISSNGVEGTVEKMDIFYTSLNTVDNKSVKLPNGTLSNSVLTNYTMFGERRVDVETGIGYENDIKTAKNIFYSVMDACPYILSDKQNEVVVKNLGESSVVLEIRMWVKTEDYWNAKFYINEKLRYALDENGINIPYNQLDVHICENSK